MSEAKWYVVHTYSGYENKVKANIDKTIENRHLEDQILEVRVPMLEVVEMKNGTQKAAQKKMFPGYVMIHMIMNDDTWYVVRNTRGVTGFVGPGSKPVPLTEAEIDALGIMDADIVVDFEVGEVVKVTKGAWKDTIGVIQEVNAQKQSLVINVELFGRENASRNKFRRSEKNVTNKSGREIPANTTRRYTKWQKKYKVILNYRFQLERQLQHHRLVQLLVNMV